MANSALSKDYILHLGIAELSRASFSTSSASRVALLINHGLLSMEFCCVKGYSIRKQVALELVADVKLSIH